MNKGLESYKKFIDGLVERKKCVKSDWIVSGKGYPKIEENIKINEFLDKLNEEQKNILSEMLKDARIGGMHDTLAYIDEMVDCENLKLIQNGEEYPTDYFESMHFDFICRLEGDEWTE